MGVSNIGTPNATFDIGHGIIAGGGAVVGAGPVDAEGGVLYETGKTDWSWPLGSGPAQTTGQWTPWSPNWYGGVVVGNQEVGGLGACDNSSCTVTLFYGRALGPEIPVGPVTVKPQGWAGIGGSFTWPARWWKPF
jgi:hypothetical protein